MIRAAARWLHTPHATFNAATLLSLFRLRCKAGSTDYYLHTHSSLSRASTWTTTISPSVFQCSMLCVSHLHLGNLPPSYPAYQKLPAHCQVCRGESMVSGYIGQMSTCCT
ncbi:hypothetical protein F5Y06DRAFT_277990, partial [Hypoxylon sp. FL0890]